MIAIFQLLALGWGTWVLYSERPILIVYHQDNFYCLSELHTVEANADLNKLTKTSGMLVTQAFLPSDTTPEETARRKTALEQLIANGDDRIWKTI